MSNVIRCDGPGCDQTKGPNDEPRLCTTAWIHVDAGDGAPALDFHDTRCLGEWALQQPGNGPTTVVAVNGEAPCGCDGAQVDPHTKAQHGVATTPVDGRCPLCTRRAGWGTDHLGKGYCKLHDGLNTRTVDGR
jgi:hypothetical protein